MTIIHLHDKYLPSIIQGCKNSTIRRGRRKYPIGSCILRTKNRDILASIEHVRYCQLCELKEEDAQYDGFHSLSELHKALAQIYPDLKKDEEMTIVIFKVELSHE